MAHNWQEIEETKGVTVRVKYEELGSLRKTSAFFSSGYPIAIDCISEQVKAEGGTIKGRGGANYPVRPKVKAEERYTRIMKIDDLENKKLGDIALETGYTEDQIKYVLKQKKFKYRQRGANKSVGKRTKTGVG